jgi:hypothetical protein
MSNSHARQTSVASFASSLYLPIDPDNKPNFDDETEAYPSSDELFGVDHEEGDDYTISSRRYLSSHSRYSSSFSHTSHPPTPPRSTISLGRSSSSSLSLTPPHARHSNADLGPSRLMLANRSAVHTTASTSAALPSPPSTAHSSNDTHLSSHMDDHSSPKVDEGVPIEKFDQLAIEHLEQDRTLLRTLRKLEDQKNRIAQLTYALSRLRILSNSACLSSDPDFPVAQRSSPPMQFHRLGAVIPKPLIVKASAFSASSSTFGRSTFSSARTNPSGLSGPSQNEAINQRRQAKQQLHEFALRRPARNAKARPSGRAASASVNQARRTGWEGSRGSPSLVVRETKDRAPGVVNHPNITMRRPKRPDAPRHLVNQPRLSEASSSSISPATPPRLASLFSSPTSTSTTRSPLTPTQGQISSAAVYESPTTPVPSRRGKPLLSRPISPTKPMRLARNMSYSYAIPPVPPLNQTTAHITLVDNTETALPLPVEEVQNRLAATFAHFSKRRASSPSPPQAPSPPRRALEVASEEHQPEFPIHAEPDHLDQLYRHKWTEQLDEHSQQARGSWKSPLKSIKQRIAGGLGMARKPSRTSIGDSSSEANPSMDGSGGYAHGLGTVQEGTLDLEELGAGKLPPGVDLKLRKKKKGSIMEEGAHMLPLAASPSGAAPSPKPSKSTWRFSRLGASQ